MNIVINLLVGFLVAVLVKFVLEYIGVPHPFPMIVAALVLLGFLFGDHLGMRWPTR